jgi:DNA-binding beta-propeller fold protein YncE
MHVLPRVAELEARFGDALVAVGVHSGKFTEERRTPNIRQACARLDVAHPVVNDRHFRIWRSYAVEAWPSVALVTPDGYLAGVQAGEFDTEAMAEAIARLVERYSAEGLLERGEASFGRDPETLPEPSGVLRFPTRVIAEGATLYVSDTGHKRVLELRREDDGAARVVRAFGSGRPGLADGAAAEARFLEPEGLAVHGGRLYVADRANQAVRAIDLGSGDVTTVAGTGALAERRMEPGPGRRVELRSPWGLAVDGDTLYVTMAGSHQMWALDLAAGDRPLRLVAGTGGENITDGPRRTATLAQPTGAVVVDGLVAFADCESSAVRIVDPAPDGEVSTLVGTGLFEFGDRDGTGDEALLQHAYDVAPWNGSLLVADTYNSKIKRVDRETRRVDALPGAAGSGEDLYEPSGIHVSGGVVLVADTNHHRIVELDPASGGLTEIEVRVAAEAGSRSR